MKRFLPFCILLSALLISSAGILSAQKDPGRSEVGQLHVSVLYATNDDPTQAGENAKLLGSEAVAALQKVEHLQFKHFRALGSDTKPILKSYENWAEPLKPSDEILLRFESSSEVSAHAMTVDLELWLSRKKVLKSNIRLIEDVPLYIKGPNWRGGSLIIAVELISRSAKKD